MEKKYLAILFLIFSIVFKIQADDLADLLQDLAIQTACLGEYSSTQAGTIDYITNRYIDPPNWYTPSLMASRFASMSGSMTRTILFYGICFDYAQFAWNDILDYQEAYNEAGMKDQQWYIAVANHGDPNIIILYDPFPPENSVDRILNGIPVREYSRYNIRTHGDATGHAWLWVQHENGTWYWIDPTWTDNTGYPWWGKVENGIEVQYYPNPDFCVARNYPRQPKQNETQTERETRSPSSTYANYTPPPQKSETGIYLGYISSFDFEKYGFILAIDDFFPDVKNVSVGSLSLEYLTNKTAEELLSLYSLIFGFTYGYQIFNNFTLYAGGGIGYNFFDNYEFTWKANGGLRLYLKGFYTKLDISYIPTMGILFSIGLGVVPVEVGYNIAYKY